MSASDLAEDIRQRHRWAPRQRVAPVLESAPAEAVSPAERVTPLRKAPNFTPAVQRWSHQLPAAETQFRLAVFGAEARDKADLARHPLHDWVRRHVANHPAGPTCVQHARSRTLGGYQTHLVHAYWVSEARFAAWRADPEVEAWWQHPARLEGELGTWREILRIPRDRQESLYWLDFPIGLSASADIALYPTPYCGYYGAMRDRLQATARDRLEIAPGATLERQSGRKGYGEHWSVHPPHNLAVIRGGSSWGFMDAEQHANYDAQLRDPVTNGMDYLDQNPLPSGCASMRWQRSADAAGNEEPDEHAHAYFLSLAHLEDWSEHHASHAAIFSAAIRRYRHYGAANQLRTWHEGFVLPEGDQLFEYLNCDPDTGLLAWFAAERLR
jgi:aldoxime dehydratase